MIDGNELQVTYSQGGLTEYAVDFVPKDNQWKPPLIDAFYDTLQKCVSLWRKKGISENYMFLGTEDVRGWRFQAVPYAKVTSYLGRMYQQLQVLWRFTFGAPRWTIDLKEFYKNLASQSKVTVHQTHTDPQCAFCQDKVIRSQIVLDGKKVQVLYNYAPIGLGGERLHFLIISKKHCPTFHALTKEEHQEAFLLAERVMQTVKNYFSSRGKPIKKVYVYHKTGKDAGQSVPHWHLHLVMTQNGAQEWLGKLTILRNILFGSFPLSKGELELQRQTYSTLLSSKNKVD